MSHELHKLKSCKDLQLWLATLENGKSFTRTESRIIINYLNTCSSAPLEDVTDLITTLMKSILHVSQLTDGCTQDILSSSLPALEMVVTKSIEAIEQALEEETESATIGEHLNLCKQCLSCSEGLLSYSRDIGSTEEFNIDTVIPSIFPSTLLNIFYALLYHCRHSNELYSKKCNASCNESLSQLHDVTVQLCMSLFTQLDTLFAATVSDMHIRMAVLHRCSTLCRLLSVTSNMKALVCGWKSYSILLSSCGGEGKDLLKREGAHDHLLQMIRDLNMEACDGLEVLVALSHKNSEEDGDTSDCSVVVRRVVKMCNYCTKLCLPLIDTFLPYASNPSIEAMLDFTLTVARCCVSVSTTSGDHQSEGPSVIGSGLSEQLYMGLQVLLTAMMRSQNFVEVLQSSFKVWRLNVLSLQGRWRDCHDVDALLQGTLNINSSTSHSWCVTTSAPLVLLCQACLGLPELKDNEGVRSATACALVDALLHYLPLCHGILVSQIKILGPPPDGRPATILPLYDWCVVAACVGVAAILECDWPLIEERLCYALIGCKPANSSNDSHSPVEMNVEISEQNCYSDDADFFEDSGTKTNSKKKPPERKCKILDIDGNEQIHWFWSHILAADSLAFTTRLGSGQLCEQLYSSICTFIATQLHPQSSLLPYIAVFLLRIKKFLPKTPKSIIEQDESAELIRSILCGPSLQRSETIPSSDPGGEQERQFCGSLIRSTIAVINRLIPDDGKSTSSGVCSAPEWRVLHHKLRCLQLMCGDTTAETLPHAGDLCQALAKIWRRFPVHSPKLSGSGVGQWLFNALAAASADLLHIMAPSLLISVVESCKVCLFHHPKPQHIVAVAGILKGLAKCQLSSSLIQHVRELAVALVTAEGNTSSSWAQNSSVEAFIFFAHTSPHAEIVAEVLKQIPVEIKDRLQMFLMQKPHPPPPAAGNSGFTPPFLFYQQNIINLNNPDKKCPTDHSSTNERQNENLGEAVLFDSSSASVRKAGVDDSTSREGGIKRTHSSEEEEDDGVHNERYDALERVIASCLSELQSAKNNKIALTEEDSRIIDGRAKHLLNEIQNVTVSKTESGLGVKKRKNITNLNFIL